MLRFRFTRSRQRWLRNILPFCVVLGCRSSDVLPPPELTVGTPVAVRLVTNGTTSGASRVTIAAIGDSVHVVWKVDAPACLLATASGAYTERLLLIEIARSGDPLANCTPGVFPYSYEATTAALPAGTYDVHVIDAQLGMARTEVGRGTVSVATK